MQQNILAPGIAYYDNVIENSKEIIDFIIENTSFKESKTFNNVEKIAESGGDYRKSLSTRFPTDNDIYGNMWNKIMNYISDYTEYWQCEIGGIYPIGCLKYLKGDGYYKSHIDDYKFSPRSLSFVLYLNDIEDGGETFFDHFNIKVKPVSGRLLIFPANFPYKHQALPTISDDKYVVIGFFAYPKAINKQA